MDMAFPVVQQRYGISVDDGAIYGCGLVLSDVVGGHGTPTQPSPPCRTSTPTDQQWPALFRADLARARPDLVLVAAGRWEVQDRKPTPKSGWVDITQPADAAYVRRQLELATSIAASENVRVGLATAPCFASGEQPDGSPWPEDDPARVRAYNQRVRSVVAAHPGQATLVDLYAMVCPGGRYHEKLDGVTVRSPDGIHYPVFAISAPNSPAPDRLADAEDFGLWIAPKVLAAVGLTG
jgi:hypothetical protein